jgi:hypothetical protein
VATRRSGSSPAEILRYSTVLPMRRQAAIITATSADPRRQPFMLELHRQIRSMQNAVQWYLCVDGPREHGLPKAIRNDTGAHILHTDRPYGTAVARNYALQHVDEDYVTTVDDDDLLVEGGIEARVDALLSDRTIGWSAGTMRWLRAAGHEEKLSQLSGVGAKEPGDVWRSWSDPQGPHALFPTTLMIRTELLRAVGGWQGIPYGEDLGMMMAVTSVARGLVLDQDVYICREHAHQTTTTNELKAVERQTRASVWQRGHDQLRALEAPYFKSFGRTEQGA